MNHSNKGFTLVEVLAVIVIGAIISFGLFNILFSSTKTHSDQLSNTKKINDSSYVLKLVTKDIRKASTYTEEGTKTIFTKVVDHSTITYQFNAEDKTITREGTIIATDIENFTITEKKDISSRKIVILLKPYQQQSKQTELVLRED